MVGRVEQYLQEMEQLSLQCFQSRSVGEHPEWQREFIECSQGLSSQISLKFKFLYDLPYTIVRARDIEVMTQCRATYDADCAAGRPCHRISDKFFSHTHESGLRRLVDSFILTGELDRSLDCELASYEWLPVDESVVEGMHRGVAGETRRSPASKLPWNSATQRLAQNLQFVEHALQESSRYNRGVLVSQKTRF